MKFSIIHASYGRPELSEETAQKWISAQSVQNEMEYILSTDASDSKLEPYLDWLYEANIINALKGHSIRHVVNITNTSVAAINAAAEMCTGDIIIVISDDFEPIKNWDLEILKAVEGKEDWILKTQDGTQPWIITLPIMDRKYYERFGYVYYPEYAHMFCDSQLTHVADLLGRKLTSSLLFKHNHYSVGGIQKDQTSLKADKTWDHGKEIYLRNFKNYFGLSGVDPWKLPPEANGHIKWLQNELRTFK